MFQGECVGIGEMGDDEDEEFRREGEEGRGGGRGRRRGLDGGTHGGMRMWWSHVELDNLTSIKIYS